MNTLQPTNGQALHSLRARTADFFRMELSRPVAATPARDHNPLRRSLSKAHSADFWVSNENMCVALWELMARS